LISILVMIYYKYYDLTQIIKTINITLSKQMSDLVNTLQTSQSHTLQNTSKIDDIVS
jgi:hypothetical protein